MGNYFKIAVAAYIDMVGLAIHTMRILLRLPVTSDPYNRIAVSQFILFPLPV